MNKIPQNIVDIVDRSNPAMQVAQIARLLNQIINGDASVAVWGYYYNNQFYEDIAHTKQIVPELKKLYISQDVFSMYGYNGSAYVPMSGGGGAEIELIEATTTTVKDYTVPDLTAEQINLAYNSYVAGKGVLISADSRYYVLKNAESVSGDVKVRITYEDKMILTYTEDEITYRMLEPLILESAGYEVKEGYSIPTLTKDQVQDAFDAFEEGQTVLIKDNLEYTHFPVIDNSTIDGTAIRALFNGTHFVKYKISGTDVDIEITQIADLETFVFRGYVSLTQPATANEGELWLASATLPTSFPVNVKRYTDGAWGTTFEQYTPKTLDVWQDKNPDPVKGYFWFASAWHDMGIDTYVEVVNTAQTGKARNTLCEGVPLKQAKIFQNIAFTAPESPDGSTSSNYTVTVSVINSTNKTIQALNFRTGAIFISVYTSGAWTAWKEVGGTQQDSGWKTMSLDSGITASVVKYRKIRDVCYICIRLIKVTTTVEGAVILFTMPNGYRPTVGDQNITAISDDGTIKRCIIQMSTGRAYLFDPVINTGYSCIIVYPVN